MAKANPRRLSFQLSEEQMKSLKPLLEQMGEINIVGTIKEGKLAVSFLACQAAFTADLRLDKKISRK